MKEVSSRSQNCKADWFKAYWPVNPDMIDVDLENLRYMRWYKEAICANPPSPRELHRALFDLHWIRVALAMRGDRGNEGRVRTGGRCPVKVGQSPEWTMADLGKLVDRKMRF